MQTNLWKLNLIELKAYFPSLSLVAISEKASN